MDNVPDDPVWELRLYAIAPNRSTDMERRVQDDLRTVFPHHGIRPAGGWTVVAGPALPMFVYITPWRNMNERSRNWAGFYVDPAWAEVRNRTNGPSELVERYEIMFLRATQPWTPLQDAKAGGQLFEMLIQETAAGRGGPARSALLDMELPAYRRAGAEVVGSFDMLSGRPLPTIVTFLAWPDWSARQRGQQALAADPELQASRRQQIETDGRCLLGRYESYLMDFVPVDWAPEPGHAS